MDLLNKLVKAQLIQPPTFLTDSVFYVARTGSVSYGCSSDTSDEDFVGFCVPPVNILFPHFAGELYGFDMNLKRFEQWQQHGIIYAEKKYDFNIYNIVKWFRLVADGNPNMVDSLFVKREDVVHSTAVSELIRENRHMFLSKKCWNSYKGYSYSQLSKSKVDKDKEIIAIWEFEKLHGIDRTTTYKAVENEIELRNYDGPIPAIANSLSHLSSMELEEYRSLFLSGMTKTKRFESQKIMGFDCKFLYHLVRLLDEVEQILTVGDLDLHRAKEHLKAIRRGDVSYDEVVKWAREKETSLEKIYAESKLPWGPRESELKALLLKCIEMHYGSIDKYVVQTSKERELLCQVAKIVQGY
jgi:hypothetical protein